MSEIEAITLLLKDAESGREGALDDLMNAVHADLERMARSHLRKHFGQRADHVTLEPAALVNETFMKLIKQRNKYDNRGQFFSIATTLMLRVLIDYRRKSSASKRGGDQERVTIQVWDEALAAHEPRPTHLIELDALVEALSQLEEFDSRKATVVKMRIVWGLDNQEIAEALEISRPTVERDWRFAKAWLAEEAGLSMVTAEESA